MSEDQEKQVNQPAQKSEPPDPSNAEGSASEFEDRSPDWMEKDLEIETTSSSTESTESPVEPESESDIQPNDSEAPSEEPKFGDRSPGRTEK